MWRNQSWDNLTAMFYGGKKIMVSLTQKEFELGPREVNWELKSPLMEPG